MSEGKHVACERCQRIVAERKIRGSVCDWCADDLELIEKQVALITGRQSNESNKDEEPLF